MSLRQTAYVEPGRSQIVLEAQADGAFVLPEARLLFGADFQRAGADLLVVNDGADTYRVPGYFAAREPADLTEPDGAVLRGDLVERLAGPIAPGQYAQVGAVPTDPPIGQVETSDGETSVQRVDGTVEVLSVGAKIFANDVIETGAGAEVSVTFVDGTIFSLSSGSRMVIDELIYDPAASDNSASISLIQGSFVFIAGQVARTGGMDVSTPSATMGIRGTTVIVDIQTIDGIVTSEVTLTRDPDGQVGRVVVRDLAGNVVADITDTDSKWLISSAEGDVREVERTILDDAEDNQLIADAVAAFQSASARAADGQGYVQPGSPDAPASTTPPAAAPEDLLALGVDPEPAPPPEPLSDTPPTESQAQGFETAFLDNDEVFNTLPDVEPPTAPGGGSGGSGGGGWNFGDNFVGGLEDVAIRGRVEGFAPNDTVLTFSLTAGAANGVVVLLDDGTYVYTPDRDYNGEDSFTVAVTDAFGETQTTTVFVTLAPVNDAPVVTSAASSAAGTVTEETDLQTGGKLSASDADIGTLLAWTGSALGKYGSFALDTNGQWTYTLNATANELGGGQVATEKFTATVSDGDGGTATQTVTVTVNGRNDAARITGTSSGAVTEDAATAAVTGQLQHTDVDLTDADNVFRAQASGSATDNGYGTFGVDASGRWTYTLDNGNAAVDALRPGETLTDSFTIRSGDGTPEQVTVTIAGANDAPQDTSPELITLAQDGSFSGSLSAIDPEGPVTFTQGGEAAENGTVTLAADGSFTYTPDAGFIGTDSFGYVLTDLDGAQVSGVVSARVSTVGHLIGDGFVADLSSTAEATAGRAAGNVTLKVSQDGAGVINLVFVVDRSAELSSAEFADQLGSLADGVEALANQFQGFANTFNVQVVGFAATSSVLLDTDLQDPALTNAILSIAQGSGSANWTAALDQTKALLDADGAGATNHVFFIAGSDPQDGSWPDSLDDLTDSAATGYSVDLHGFDSSGDGISALSALVEDPQALVSGSSISGSLPAIAGGLPDTSTLEISLVADGVDQGTIFTVRTPDDGRSTILSSVDLATIDGLAELLGEINVFSARATLQGEGAAGPVSTGLSDRLVLQAASDAVTATGSTGADLLLGGYEDDLIDGSDGADILLGFAGDDTLQGGAGADSVFGGDGDDRLLAAADPGGGTDLIDGGAGQDTLAFTDAGNLDDLMPVLDINDIEALDMANGLSNSLTISGDDIFALSSGPSETLEDLLDRALPDSAIIYGDAQDSLTLQNTATGSFRRGSDAPVPDGEGQSLAIYEFVDGGGNVLATLGVDDDIAVTVAPAG
ncbi:VCBS domain-containing protein [Sulfitobacter sp. D35]|uniref:VCBS domain-containing protein n=1 Tax=Sulfitobacter sp. D35 TaxID=3083252 RepID=UPI00296FC688|nr:VCBS domain-containing protein [Sulfitobacter sp. D35]MDW4496598.1 VCBS domain-containing protein [Sulfitobacter sp. D35]